MQVIDNQIYEGLLLRPIKQAHKQSSDTSPWVKIITIAEAIEMPISKNVGFGLKEIYYEGTYEQELLIKSIFEVSSILIVLITI